jgi:NitT/TauT family transport system permease protein
VNPRLGYALAFAVVVLGTWELATRIGGVKPILLPPFSASVAELWDGMTRGWLWGHVGATALVWVVGFLIASIVGILFGIAVGISRRASIIANPWLNAIYVTPDIALVPIFILWFGIGIEFKIWYVFLSGFFFVAVNTLAGVRAVEGRFVAVANSFDAPRLVALRTVLIPGSIPYIITGLRQAAGRSLVGVVAAEFVASNSGLGFMISVAGQTFNTDRVIAGIFILAAAGIGVAELLRVVERRFDAWRA